MSLLNSCTCFLMCNKNASLDQHLTSMIMYTGIPARYIAIAAPLLAECSPIQSSVKPKLSFPITFVALRSCFNRSEPVFL
jgi:hypothetical protein